MTDTFKSYHPLVNFVYFAVVISLSMFFMHPIFLGISFAGAFFYSLWQNGKKALKFNVVYLFLLMITAALLNPAFNHEGRTILFYLPNDNPVTSESIVYGVVSSVMLGTVILWFSCFHSVMTSDKLMYLSGKAAPSLSLVFSMILRFIPLFKTQLRAIASAQKAIGKDAATGNIFSRIHNGANILSILVTWALENGIDTADSMKARGFGLPHRTSFSLYHFEKRDVFALTAMAAFFCVILFDILTKQTAVRFFPTVKYSVSPQSIVATCLLCLFPLILCALEELKWNSLQSKM